MVERWQPGEAGDGFDEAGLVEGGVPGGATGVNQLLDGVDDEIFFGKDRLRDLEEAILARR